MVKTTYVLYYRYPGESYGEPILCVDNRDTAQLLLDVLKEYASESKEWACKAVTLIPDLNAKPVIENIDINPDKQL